MKIKSLLVLIALLPLAGCFTTSALERARPSVVTKSVRFRPVGLYGNTVTGDCAFKGFVVGARAESRQVAFLIVPKATAAAIAGKVERGTFGAAADRVRSLGLDGTLTLTDQLPDGFAEITDGERVSGLTFETADVAIGKTVARNDAELLMLPGAVVMDAVSAPLQIWVFTNLRSWR